MASERLTYAELDIVLLNVRRAATELRERRGADLSNIELNALNWMRHRWAEDEHASGSSEWRRMHPVALAALDKLLLKGNANGE